MGIIFHFVTDFFCVPHNQRWEFKDHMIPHVKYEAILDNKVKTVNMVDKLTLPAIKDHSRESISLFLNELLAEYELKNDYMRDVIYSVNVCSALCTFILERIYSNTVSKTA
jgi:Zinc dependent phospholipase C